MLKKKRIQSLMFVLLFCAAALFSYPASAASSLPELYVNSYTPTATTVYPSSSTAFTLALAIDSSIEAGLNPAIKLKPSTGGSFSFADGSVVKTFNHTNGILSGIVLRYTGADKSFSFTLYYDKDNDGVYESDYEQTIHIANARTSSENTVPPIEHDPAYFKPVLSIGGDIPSFSAGIKSYLSFKLNNTGSYDARNITVSFTTETPVIIPSSISGKNTLEDVPSGGSKDVNIFMTPYGTLATGYYTLNFNLSYKNSYGDSYTETIPLTIHVTGKTESDPVVGKPLIDISSISQDRMTPGADGVINLTVNLKNSGGADAGLVTLSLSGYTADTFTPASATGTYRINDFESGDTRSAVFGLKVSAKLATGVYPLTLTVAFPDGSGGTATATETVFISVVRSASSGLRISKATLNTSTPGSDNLVELTVGLANDGKKALTDIEVSLAGLSSDKLSLYGTVGGKAVASLAAGGSTSVKFPLYVSETLTSGNHNLTVKLRYIDGSGSAVETENEVYVYISRPGASSGGKTGTPRIIVAQYTAGDGLIRAGEAFDFTFTLKNTSAATDVRNIKINVSSADGVFMPTAGTSSFFVESIPAGGSTTMTVSLTAKMDAETKSYPITVAVDYEDKTATPYSVSEAISIPVNQPQRVELSNLSYYGEGMAPSNINFQFVNKGRSVLYNLSIHIEGPFTSQNGELFVGNFAAGSMDYFDDMITPTETGELTGKVVFTYEDANGNKTEHVEEFNASIFDQGGIDPGKEEPFPVDPGIVEPVSTGMPLWLLIVIIAGGVILVGGGITAFVMIRRKKKRVEAEEDE